MAVISFTRGIFRVNVLQAATSWRRSPFRPAGEPPHVCSSVNAPQDSLHGNTKGESNFLYVGKQMIRPILSEPFEGHPSSLLFRFCSQRSFAISVLNPHIYRGVLYPRVPQPYVLVVLLRTVPGIGTAGEVRYVRRGYFRHSLARKGWALAATWQNIDLVHNRIQQLKRKQQQQQAQRHSIPTSEEQKGDGSEGVATESTSVAGFTAGASGVALPLDDGGPVLSWLRRLRLQYLVETEETDHFQLREPLMPQHLLQKLSEQEGLDLLPGQLRLVRRRLPSSTHAQQQPQQGEWSEELLQGDPLATITRTGEYDIVVLLPSKSRPLARAFTLEVVSKTETERRIEMDKLKNMEAEKQQVFSLPSLH